MLSNDLLLHADAHYHRRGCVSLPSSEWDRVVPQRYCHQGEGGGSRFGRRINPGTDRAHALMGWDVASRLLLAKRLVRMPSTCCRG